MDFPGMSQFSAVYLLADHQLQRSAAQLFVGTDICIIRAQVAVVACQLAVHCRRVEDMGILSLQAFQTAVATQRMQVTRPTLDLLCSNHTHSCWQ